MSAQIFYNNGSSSSEIITHLVNASDGAGLHFTGASGTYVDCGDTTILDGATRMSMEFIASTSSTSTGLLMSKSYSAHCFKLQFNAAGTITAHINNGSTLASPTTSGTYNDGNPKHIVLTWDNATVSIYVNGNLDGTATLAGGSLPNTVDKLAIGAELNSSTSNINNFDGDIYRARLWNRDVSADVQSLYENASIDFADQWGSQTDLINATSSGSGTAWTGASGTTPPTGWTAGGTGRTFTIDSSSGSGAEPALKITAGSSNAFIKSNLTTSKGKRYVLEFIYKNTAGDIAQYSVDEASTLVDLASSTSWSSVQSVEFTGTGGNDLYLLAKSAGDIVWFDTVNIREVGAVADFDLAFANPTQSTIVQDRAGVADGTAAGGVTQITKLEAVNTNKLNVGGTTPLVGIGVAAGVTPARRLQVNDATEPDILLTRTAGATSGALGNIYFGAQDGDKYLCHVGAAQDGAVDAGKLEFSTEATGGARATRLTISSAGLASFTGGISVNQIASPSGNLALNPNSGLVTVGGVVQASGSGTNSFAGTLATTGLATFSAGIVETNGVLKENLLSNSGFDVWSNSTFENTGSDLIDNGDFASASDWGVSTGAWVIGSGVATFTTGSGTSILSQGSLGTTSGKLYKLTFTVGTATATIAITNASASGTLVAEADYAVGAHTVVYEDVGNNDIAFTSSGGNSYTLDNVSLHEGVPGCVAANALAMDGWSKSSSGNLDVFRQHNDGGTYTHDGSFYGLKATTSGTVGYIHPNDFTATEIARFAGRKVTAGFWAKTSTANHVRMRIYDNVTGVSYSDYCPNDGNWHWLEHTATINAAATSVYPLTIYFDVSGVDAYISQPMLVFGNAIGAGNYSRPSGEIIYNEVDYDSVSYADSGTLTSNTTGSAIGSPRCNSPRVSSRTSGDKPSRPPMSSLSPLPMPRCPLPR